MRNNYIVLIYILNTWIFDLSAQQKISFYKKNNEETELKEFVLPHKVKYEFENGRKQNMILKEVRNDTFLFEGKKGLLTIPFDEIESLRFLSDEYHRKMGWMIFTTTFTALNTVVFFVIDSRKNDRSYSYRASGPVFFMTSLIFIPLSFYSIIVIPQKYRHKRHGYFIN
jgi:hypothetical protein